MGSDMFTSKKSEVGDNSTIDIVHDATIPGGTTISVTLFEDVGGDGSGANTDALGNAYDNSNSGALSGGGGNTLSLSGFDGGGSTNDYWLKVDIDGDGTDPTLDSPTVDSVDVAAASAGGGGGAGSVLTTDSNGVIQTDSSGIIQTQ